MCLVGAAYAGTILWETRFYSSNYPPTKIGVDESEVRYMLGAPDAVEQGGALYRYTEPGRVIEARLSSSGQLVSISCQAGPREPTTCPRIRGINIGTDEYDILRKLGWPSRQTFQGNDKTLHYDGMGMAFQLRQFKVLKTELGEGSSFIGYFPHALYAMVP